MTLPPETIAELRALLAKAAPAPWTADSIDSEDGRGKYKAYAVFDAEGKEILDTQNAHYMAVEIYEERDEEGTYAWDERGRLNAELAAAACSNLPALLDTAERAAELEAEHSVSITVGFGLLVYGSMEAISRVQQYILLDSSHPVEANDVRRMLAKDLQTAEDKIAALEAQNAKLRESTLIHAADLVNQLRDEADGGFLTPEEVAAIGYFATDLVARLRAAAALKGDKA